VKDALFQRIFKRNDGMFKIHDVTQWEVNMNHNAALRTAIFTVLEQMNCQPKYSGVFIKPNIGATSVDVNTDPSFVQGLIHWLKTRGIEDIIIGEGAVETEYESSDYNFRFQGWEKLAEEEKVKLVDLNHTDREDIVFMGGGKIALPTIMRGRSYINVAKMKTHMQTLVSLCVKNQKGLLDTPTRKMFHKFGLHEPIAELGKIVKPELCIVDANIAVEGNGPGNWGTLRKVGKLIAGDNMIEVDSVCCHLMSINPDDVEHLRLLRDRHFKDKAWLDKIPPALKPPFKRPASTFTMFKTHLRPENACTACLSSVGKMNKLARKSWLGVKVFSRRGLVQRLDIVVGSPDDVPFRHGYLLFYGDCAKTLAKRYPEYPFIQGCPPVSQKALEQLAKGK
jgi:uncharacterized protein (DUF362 family)